MKTFIYTVQHNSPVRGYNRRVTVYRIKQNVPTYLGYTDANTAGSKGDYAMACEVIASKREGRLTEVGYKLTNNTYKVIEV